MSQNGSNSFPLQPYIFSELFSCYLCGKAYHIRLTKIKDNIFFINYLITNLSLNKHHPRYQIPRLGTRLTYLRWVVLTISSLYTVGQISINTKNCKVYSPFVYCKGPFTNFSIWFLTVCTIRPTPHVLILSTLWLKLTPFKVIWVLHACWGVFGDPYQNW